MPGGAWHCPAGIRSAGGPGATSTAPSRPRHTAVTASTSTGRGSGRTRGPRLGRPGRGRPGVPRSTIGPGAAAAPRARANSPRRPASARRPGAHTAINCYTRPRRPRPSLPSPRPALPGGGYRARPEPAGRARKSHSTVRKKAEAWTATRHRLAALRRRDGGAPRARGAAGLTCVDVSGRLCGAGRVVALPPTPAPRWGGRPINLSLGRPPRPATHPNIRTLPTHGPLDRPRDPPLPTPPCEAAEPAEPPIGGERKVSGGYRLLALMALRE